MKRYHIHFFRWIRNLFCKNKKAIDRLFTIEDIYGLTTRKKILQCLDEENIMLALNEVVGKLITFNAYSALKVDEGRHIRDGVFIPTAEPLRLHFVTAKFLWVFDFDDVFVDSKFLICSRMSVKPIK